VSGTAVVDDLPDEVLLMGSSTDDRFPALQSRRNRPIDGRVDQARRLLWRAYQHGALNAEEFASTLDRLDFDSGLPDPLPPKPHET
jgi:hypothetical protein